MGRKTGLDTEGVVRAREVGWSCRAQVIRLRGQLRLRLAGLMGAKAEEAFMERRQEVSGTSFGG